MQFLGIDKIVQRSGERCNVTSFNRDDYSHLFDLGAELYDIKVSKTRRREIAVTIMAMAEAVIGEQGKWPCIDKRHQKYTTYWLHSMDK